MAALSLSTLISLLLLSLGVSSVAIDAQEVFIVRLAGHALPLATKFNKAIGLSAASEETFVKSTIQMQQKLLARADVPLASVRYHYTRSLNGFAAVLSNEQVEALQGLQGVISVTPDISYKVATVDTPSFLGLNDPATFSPPGLYSKTNGSGVIIGVLDSGIWPENPSFSDVGMPPVPKRFKGICQAGEDWPSTTCNRKIIGNRYYSRTNSSRDTDGHGTHTASTAAGAKVANVSLGGAFVGQAQGMAYGAHIVMYRVCDANGDCWNSNMIQALDDAIKDKIDILSISIGPRFGTHPLNSNLEWAYFETSVAGIAMSLSAGNEGPDLGTVGNAAPWYMSVGASSTKRVFHSLANLGDGTSYNGFAISNGTVPAGASTPMLPIVYAGNVAADGAAILNAQQCYPYTLNTSLIAGKIVLCDRGVIARVEKGFNVRTMGGAGMILRDTSPSQTPIEDVHALPASHVGYADGVTIYNYVENTANPMASIAATVKAYNSIPSVASFSSRGPGPYSVMKPDITAPGVAILASFPPNGAYNFFGDSFSFLSGTSMAAPHVAGVMALLKSLKPNWSSTAIYSALTTTAAPLASGGPLDFGGGEMRPNSGANPGLVYESGLPDIKKYLCNYYDAADYREVFGMDCPVRYGPFHYNKPSLMMTGVKRSGFGTIRKVKNVGPKGKYTVRIVQPKGAIVTIKPSTLNFVRTGQTLAFKIFVVGTAITRNIDTGNYNFGSWTWKSSDGKYNVTSPIIVNIAGLP